MTRSMKAVLLSALVFPGTGHFYLKKRIVGAILVGASVFSLYALTSEALNTALQVADRIERGEVQPDAAAITELLEQQSSASQGGLAGVAPLLLLGCWLFGIADSWRLGRIADRAEKNPGP
jgi:hypothetical protein